MPSEALHRADIEFLNQFESECFDLLKFFISSHVLPTDFTKVQLECFMTSTVRFFDGDCEDLIACLEANETLISSLNSAPHILSRQLIAEMLESSISRQFLFKNFKILHNLRTFEDFTPVTLPHVDIERLGVAFNTFPLPLLKESLKVRGFQLNDPNRF